MNYATRTQTLHSGDEESDMAMMAHGSIGAFDSSEEGWETYVERDELCLAANKITDASQKRDVLLSICGVKTYHILRDTPRAAETE